MFSSIFKSISSFRQGFFRSFFDVFACFIVLPLVLNNFPTYFNILQMIVSKCSTYFSIFNWSSAVVQHISEFIMVFTSFSKLFHHLSLYQSFFFFGTISKGVLFSNMHFWAAYDRLPFLDELVTTNSYFSIFIPYNYLFPEISKMVDQYHQTIKKSTHNCWSGVPKLKDWITPQVNFFQ